jgi:hypothetical protein
MKVKNCTQVFSHTVGIAMHVAPRISSELTPESEFYLTPKAVDTADLLLFFDKLFDSDMKKLIQACMANLTLIMDHLTCCKDGLGKRQNYLIAADLIQKGLQQVLDIGSGASNTQPGDIAEEIRRIVEEAIESKLTAITAVTSEVPRQANPAAVPKYKVIVTPSATYKNINTADDTRKLLM